MHQIDTDIAAETHRLLEVRREHQNLPVHGTNDPPRQPWVSAEDSTFVSAYRPKIENQRVRTNASTPVLVPLFAMLIAALPVPAHEDFLAPVTAVTSLSLPKWVSEMRAASKSEVRMWCLACSLQTVTLHWKIFTTPWQSQICANVFASSSVRVMTKRVAPFLATRVTNLKLCQTMSTFIALFTVLKQRDSHRIVECVQSHLQPQGKPAERIDPYDCECRGCPDRPVKGEGRILPQSVC